MNPFLLAAIMVGSGIVCYNYLSIRKQKGNPRPTRAQRMTRETQKWTAILAALFSILLVLAAMIGG